MSTGYLGTCVLDAATFLDYLAAYLCRKLSRADTVVGILLCILVHYISRGPLLFNIIQSSVIRGTPSLAQS
jgi:hypothetical protein